MSRKAALSTKQEIYPRQLPPLRALKLAVNALSGLGFGESIAPEEVRNRGFFRIEIHARTSTGARYVARVEAQGDPGYAATAVMLGESALSLVLDGDRLPPVAGVLTPATAMNGALSQRLRAAGFTLEVARQA